MTRSQGVHGDGARSFTPAQRARLIDYLTNYHAGPDHAVKVADLAAVTGLGGRTVRAILSECDGTDLLLGGGDSGYYVARSRDEAATLTGRIGSQAIKMLSRVRRRDTFAETLS